MKRRGIHKSKMEGGEWGWRDLLKDLARTMVKLTGKLTVEEDPLYGISKTFPSTNETYKMGTRSH